VIFFPKLTIVHVLLRMPPLTPRERMERISSIALYEKQRLARPLIGRRRGNHGQDSLFRISNGILMHTLFFFGSKRCRLVFPPRRLAASLATGLRAN